MLRWRGFSVGRRVAGVLVGCRVESVRLGWERYVRFMTSSGAANPGCRRLFRRRLEFLVRPKGADHQWGKDPLK